MAEGRSVCYGENQLQVDDGFGGVPLFGMGRPIKRGQSHLRKQFRKSGGGQGAGGFPGPGWRVRGEGGGWQQISGIARGAARYVWAALWPDRKRKRSGFRARSWHGQGAAFSDVWDRGERRRGLQVAGLPREKTAGIVQRG